MPSQRLTKSSLSCRPERIGAGLGKSYDALETVKKAQSIREMLAKDPRDLKAQMELAENYLLTAFLVGRAASADERLQYDQKALAITERLYAVDAKNPDYQDLLARGHTSFAYALDVLRSLGGVPEDFRRATLRKTA